MKNIIDYGSINVHSGYFLLKKFIESDAPGTLSWLNMDAIDLNSEILPFKEVEVDSPCTAARLNREGVGCKLKCLRCRRQQSESSDKLSETK